MPKKLPTIGPKALDMAKLSPAAKAKLKRRAERAARREYRPQIKSARRDVAQARRAGRREARSIRGATNMLSDNLDSAIASLRNSGLKGQFLRDAARELAARQGDLLAGENLLLAENRQETRAGVSDAREALQGLQVDRKVSAAEGYSSLLGSAFEDAESALARRRQNREERRDEREKGREERTDKEQERKKAMRTAFHVAAREYTTFENKPSSEVDWAAFEKLVAQSEEVSPLAAKKAVEKLRKRLKKQNERLFGGETAEGDL